MVTSHKKTAPDFPITDLGFLKKLVPHREPVLLIDTLHNCNEQLLVSSLTITEQNLFVKSSEFSEAGIIEHMAQSVAMHTGYHGYLKAEKVREGYIGAIKKVEIHSLPNIGEMLKTTVSILYSAMDMTLVQLISKVKNETIATAEMSTILKPESN